MKAEHFFTFMHSMLRYAMGALGKGESQRALAGDPG